MTDSANDLGLDPRLLRALGKKGFAELTPVQVQVIPKVRHSMHAPPAGSHSDKPAMTLLQAVDIPPSHSGFCHLSPATVVAGSQVLEGKDIVARARTGSGKTLAYLLPALHKVLTAGRGRTGWQALVLVPTRELCEQVNSLSRASFAQMRTRALRGLAGASAHCVPIVCSRARAQRASARQTCYAWELP